MTRTGRIIAVNRLCWILGTLAAVVLIAMAIGALTRFEVTLGPVVARSQHGLHVPIEIPEDGRFHEQQPRSPQSTEHRPTNVVLVIGDGMGLGMVSSASLLIHGPAQGLNFERAPVTGLMKTHAANALVTDSAAAGTAMACGFKTDRKKLGMLPDGRPVKNLFEAARESGMATGVVTTSGLMDATPASFTAHNAHRDNEEAILADQLLSRTDLMIGAAWGHLEASGKAGDLADAVTDAAARGITFVTNPAELAAASIPFVALFPPRSNSPEAGGPELEMSVGKALSALSDNGSPFILVVESEETDEFGHDNNADRIVESMGELERAISRILEFAGERGDTLVLITADHDTGNMSVVRGRPDEGRAQIRWATDGHTGTWVPLFAFGPGAEAFNGVFDNTEIARRLADMLELPDFPRIDETYPR